MLKQIPLYDLSTTITGKHLSWQEKRKIIQGSAGATLVGLPICITIFCFKYMSRNNNKDIGEFLKTHEAFSVRRKWPTTSKSN